MKHILIVDDSDLIRLAASNVLKTRYKISTAKNGQEALDFLRKYPVDLLLMDLDMPEMGGIETLKQMKLDNSLGTIPVIFLTGNNRAQIEASCLALGAQDFIYKPFNPPVMLCRVARVIELDCLKKNLEAEVIKKTKEVEKLTLQTITAFADSIDVRIGHTNRHSFHVAKYAEQVGRLLGFSELELRDLFYAALLHDIGKIGIPDFILNKPEPLSADEYNIIKRHPEIGGRILKEITVVPFLSIAASTHHEWFNGNGYPLGLKGEEIPLVGRIIALADAVDAMCSERVYRPRLTTKQAAAELIRCAGTQFDPFLAKIMAAVLEWGVDLSEDDGMQSTHGNLLETVMNEYMKVSQKDSLTGLWNRAYVEKNIELLCQDPDARGAFILIDVDNFKFVNDEQGHQMGDAYLRLLGECICLELQGEDFAGRLGGDEFVIFFDNVWNREDVRERVDRLLSRLEAAADSRDAPRATVSAGIAMMPEDGNSFSTLYHNSDKSLYYVKRRGKNSIFFFSQEAEESEFAYSGAL